VPAAGEVSENQFSTWSAHTVDCVTQSVSQGFNHDTALWEGIMKPGIRKSETPPLQSAPRGNERRLATQHARRRILSLAAGAAALPAMSRVARSQAYPTRPITLVVPFAPGGASDVIGRILAQRMKASLGQTIVIETVAGASGSLGTGRVARAAPDGYTFIVGNVGTHAINGAVYALKYDVLSDFDPVALVATQPFMVVSRKAMPADDLKGLIAWLKDNPGKASAGTAGVGAPDHVGGALFQTLTGTRFQFVPYRGGGPAVQDLVAGQLDIMFESPSITLPQVRSGQLKAFAVAGESRLAGAPEIPTADEAGLPGFYVPFWVGLWAPKGTPKDVIAKLNSAAVTALADPTVSTLLTDLGFEIYCPTSRRPRRLPPIRRLKSRNGRQSLRSSGSRRNDPGGGSGSRAADQIATSMWPLRPTKRTNPFRPWRSYKGHRSG
jgi:tripartite-type tricarboxylate transporter receptor subunit TctC